MLIPSVSSLSCLQLSWARATDAAPASVVRTPSAFSCSTRWTNRRVIHDSGRQDGLRLTGRRNAEKVQPAHSSCPAGYIVVFLAVIFGWPCMNFAQRYLKSLTFLIGSSRGFRQNESWDSTGGSEVDVHGYSLHWVRKYWFCYLFRLSLRLFYQSELVQEERIINR